MGFDITRSDLPLRIAFPVMMGNIINWLRPRALGVSSLHTRPGDPFDIYPASETESFFLSGCVGQHRG